MATLATVTLLLDCEDSASTMDAISGLLSGQERVRDSQSPLVDFSVLSDVIPYNLQPNYRKGAAFSALNPTEPNPSLEPIAVVVRDGHLCIESKSSCWADLGARQVPMNMEHAQTIVRSVQSHEVLMAAVRDAMHHIALLEGEQKPQRSTADILAILANALIRGKQPLNMELSARSEAKVAIAA